MYGNAYRTKPKHFFLVFVFFPSCPPPAASGLHTHTLHFTILPTRIRQIDWGGEYHFHSQDRSLQRRQRCRRRDTRLGRLRRPCRCYLRS